MILIDTSVWIDYFKKSSNAVQINDLIDKYEICINDIIRAELCPLILSKGQFRLNDLINALPIIPLNIEWNNIIDMQITNIKNGINKVGISDLIIVQNALQNHVSIMTLDKHFALMQSQFSFDLYLMKSCV